MNRMSFYMECFHMYIVITLLSKIFMTNGALVRSLSGVNSDMVIQIVFPKESFTTEYALVLFFTSVFAHMQL